MKVGDLVKIKPYCYCGGEYGIVVHGPDELNAIIMIVIDTGKAVGSLASNVEVINGNR